MKAAATARNRLTLRPPSAKPGRGSRDVSAALLPISAAQPIPIWGGVECTCNRVEDLFFDQAELSGHESRLEDFDQIAPLGIKTLRIGVLWERYVRHGWDMADAQLEKMRSLQIRPVAGLLHHGSGPSRIDLLDDSFPVKLAEYAGSVAQRYPDIDSYTPVNEPNTTARFSGLYGLWYPHHRSHHSYFRALLNQVKGTVLSMEAIRRVRPDARLIQTDDCGSITGTDELQATAELLHTRQWLTFDLLFGRVDRHHPMFGYLLSHGMAESSILWFSDHPCPPQVVGVNYYATSDRHLDHRRWLYPESMTSSEGPFVDVEAVRVEGCAEVDFCRPVMEAWRRYQYPVALTEVHLGGPPAEQIRWLAAAYSAMQRAQSAGVQCEALTVWALLGSFFWNELVTRNNGYYEPGAFDVSSGMPVRTALGDFAASLAYGRGTNHSALSEPGWWARNDRTCYPWVNGSDTKAA